MADNLQRVGLVFKADGTVDFNKSLKEVNASIQENYSAFKLAKAGWDESTKSVEKLKDEQKYLTDQTKDYSDKVKMLEGELEELQQKEKKNADEIKKKREQLDAAVKTTESYKKKCEDLKADLEQLEMSENRNESAIEKKRKELEKAEKGFLDYSSKVEKLEEKIEKLNKGEANNEAAVKKKKTQINQAKTSLKNYENALERVEKELKYGTAELKEYAQKLDYLGEKAKNTGDKLGGLSAGAAGVATAVAATVPATEEYRKIMGSLEVSSELAGYSAEQTEEVYKKLFGVLGDDQTAATTTANLQALGLTQEQLMQLVNGTVGAWAKYGDSIPIDGLAEAINETVKAGQVTGNFADVLNWAEGSEDAFNEKLANCKTEAERTNLVMQELANQGLMQAGEKWQENNKALTDSNEAQAELQEQTARLAETVAPAVTEITKLVTSLLEGFNNIPVGTQKAIGGIVLLVASFAPLMSGIGMVTQGISGTITATTKIGSLLTTGGPKVTGILSSIGGGAKALFGIIAAHPVITVITAIIAIVVTLYNKCEWFRNGVNRIFGEIGNFIKNCAEDIKGFLDFEWKLPKIKLPHFSISGEFSLNPPKMPKFAVQWYAKGGILNSPTIFGTNGSTFMGGGEAGPEAVLPIELLRRYIREENQLSKNELLAALLEVLGEIVLAPEIILYLGNERLTDIMSDSVSVKIGERQNAKWRARGSV